MSPPVAMRRAREPGSIRVAPARRNYGKEEYRYARDRETVLILILFMLLIVVLFYFS